MHTRTSIMIKPPSMTAANTALRLIFALAAAGHFAAAYASLGGDAASVDADRLHMNVKQPARLKASANGSYTVNESILPSGTRVRQYLSASGVVFAVSWSGPFLPDFRQLLGPHFDTMVAEQAKLTHAGHKFFGLHESGLVIESGGHQRSFAGRAYLPSALPPGINVQDIQ
ncbi:MAG: DUF2844 domain-containing protein [Gallionella sp.]